MDTETNNESLVQCSPTENLLACERCGSEDFCLTREFTYSFTYIRCRQCDKVFGLAEKTKY